ncbi:MAG: hypothetical protein ACKVZ0_23440 [Gemmatimonadales bacterium]
MNRLFFSVLLVGVASGCSSGVTVDPDVLTGTYRATQFTIERSGQPTVNVLAVGGSVQLELKVGLTTAGRLVIPVAAGIATTAIDDDLIGQYQVIGPSVIRYQSLNPGVFIDSYLFTSDPPELRAFLSLQQPAGQISLVLRKQ